MRSRGDSCLIINLLVSVRGLFFGDFQNEKKCITNNRNINAIEVTIVAWQVGRCDWVHIAVHPALMRHLSQAHVVSNKATGSYAGTWLPLDGPAGFIVV